MHMSMHMSTHTSMHRQSTAAAGHEATELHPQIYIVMAYIVMAYTVMAYIGMACAPSIHSGIWPQSRGTPSSDLMRHATRVARPVDRMEHSKEHWMEHSKERWIKHSKEH